MPDNFQNVPKGIEAPATRHFAITPSNSTDMTNRPRALYVSVGGNLALRDEKGVEITYAVTAGQVILFRAVRVLATGTTATVIGWE